MLDLTVWDSREQKAWRDFEPWRREDLERYNADWFAKHPDRRYRIEGSSIVPHAVHVFERGHDMPVAIIAGARSAENTDRVAVRLLAHREILATRDAVKRPNVAQLGRFAK
jgi:hypothetical protein